MKGVEVEGMKVEVTEGVERVDGLKVEGVEVVRKSRIENRESRIKIDLH